MRKETQDKKWITLKIFYIIVSLILDLENSLSTNSKTKTHLLQTTFYNIISTIRWSLLSLFALLPANHHTFVIIISLFTSLHGKSSFNRITNVPFPLCLKAACIGIYQCLMRNALREYDIGMKRDEITRGKVRYNDVLAGYARQGDLELW